MKTFYSYEHYRGACKIRAYLNTNNISYTEWRDMEGGYEFQASVTPEQYNDLMNM